MIERDGVKWNDEQQRHGAMLAFWGLVFLAVFIIAARCAWLWLA